MKPEEEYYDPDADVRPPSPGLVPTKINYKPEVTPPPYITTSPSDSAASSEQENSRNSRERPGGRAQGSGSKKSKKRRRRGRRKKGRTGPSRGDAVLISNLDPNRPDIARAVAERSLNSASQSESDYLEQDMSEDGDEEDNSRTENHYYPGNANASELKHTARAAYDVVMEDADPEKSVTSVSPALPRALNGGIPTPGLNTENLRTHARLGDLHDPKARSKFLHPPSLLEIPPLLSERNGDGEDDSITTSPALAPFAISRAEANPASTLPAMQKSPPRSASTHSPDRTQSLPSIKTALGQVPDPPIVGTPNGILPYSQNPGQSPTMTRPQFAPGNPIPSPGVYSQPSPASSKDLPGMSPPPYTSNPSFYRTTSKEGSLSTASPSTVSALTPTSNYTPKEMASPENNTAPPVMIVPSTASGPFAPSPFKCTHPGCTAAPFQTQYLLNSHANVHSSSRPHYCPVKSCPRSIGGKGFKRKNEMIRHGLVHDSPGYMCPFCADQQHKYPRPDNLQRCDLDPLWKFLADGDFPGTFEFITQTSSVMTHNCVKSWLCGTEMRVEAVGDVSVHEPPLHSLFETRPSLTLR